MLFSIITVCKNSVNNIENTLQSVFNQDYPKIEYIIIDGNSTDGTQALISKYKDKIKYFESTPDNGIYDAMNKGIKASSGDIIFFLNSGDTFRDKTAITKVAAIFNKINPDIVYTDVILFDNLNPNNQQVKQHGIIDKPFFLLFTLCHQAVYAKKNLFDKYGIFDLEYKISADHEWLLRIFSKSRKFYYLPEPLVNYDMSGITSNPTELQNAQHILERKKAREIYFSRLELKLIGTKIFKWLAHRPLSKYLLWRILGWNNKYHK